MQDIDKLSSDAGNGNLTFRLDANKYIVSWKETILGLNQFTENVVNPIKETQNALEHFSVGNFFHRITNEYAGEFNEIKKTVNYIA